MKTLYEQLTQEQLEVIKERDIKYPTITGDVVEALKSNYVVTKLTMGDALNVHNIFYPYKGFDFCELYKLFEN